MSTKQPNVLFLFPDQHRADVVGFEGHPDLETPSLDRLASDGTRFERAYCQDAVCEPSRCSLFSGLYPRTLGCLGNDDRSRVMEEVVSLQASFRANGYATGAFGKRHLRLRCDEGWSHARGYGRDESDPCYFDLIKEQGYGDEFARDWAAEWGPDQPGEDNKPSAAPLSAQATRLPEGMTMEAYTRRESISFIREQVKAKRPFFCWSSFYRPHQPYTPLRRYYDRFDRSHWGLGARAGDGIAKPPAFDQPAQELPPVLRLRRGQREKPWCLQTAHEDERIFRDAIAAYYACIAEIDEHVGSILDELERLGILEDTIVIYTSDHGEFAGGHGMMEKMATGHNVYEDTLRVPLIVSWPGRIRMGQASSDLVELVDLYPTLLELCRFARPDSAYSLAGRSLAAHLCEGVPVGRRYAISENWSQVSVISDRYKLGHWLDPCIDPDSDFRSYGDMLFDREDGLHETRNRFADSGYELIVAELMAMYREWELTVPSAGKLELASRSTQRQEGAVR